MRKLLVLLCCQLPFGFLQAQVEKGSFLLENVILHTEEGLIENGVLGVFGDSIVLVGDARRVKFNKGVYETVIDGQNQHVWPGFIALNSTIGLTEIDAVRATRDFAEVGEINPHVRSLAAYNTDSKIIPTVRSNGVLITQACPREGLISGSSSVFQLAGWNWEDAVLSADDGIHLQWPKAPSLPDKSDTTRRGKAYAGRMESLHDFFRESVAYKASEKKSSRNLRLEAMTPVLSGSSALYLHVSAARDIEDAVLFAKSYQIPRIVIVGAEESDQIIPFLKKHGVSVILSRVHRLPDLPDQTPDEIYSQAARLQQGGILVALSYDGDMEAMGTRNLPFLAGTVSAYGVSETEALNMISLNPARITGIDHHFGSLTAGKKAMFFLTKGNALDMKTSGATRIWMLGLEVSNDNLQKELYRKYMHKYGKDEFIQK